VRKIVKKEKCYYCSPLNRTSINEQCYLCATKELNEKKIVKKVNKKLKLEEKINEEKRLEFFNKKADNDKLREEYFKEHEEEINFYLDEYAKKARYESEQYLIAVRRFNYELKSVTLFRDNYKCVLCKETNEEKLYTHHIVPTNIDKTRVDDKTNLVTLCKTCHLLAHNNCWNDINATIAEKLNNYIKSLEYYEAI
jgi:5-methylcytosine-specific restriction endonuclease McrA